MKSLITALTILFVSNIASAEVYLGIYQPTVISSEQTTNNEISNETRSPKILVGIRSNGTTGVSADITHNGSGGDLSIGLFTEANGFRFNVGAIYANDASVGQNKYGSVRSSQSNLGAYIGVDYKLISVRYIEYTVDHFYVNGKYNVSNEKVTYEGSRTDNSVTRGILWIGAIQNF